MPDTVTLYYAPQTRASGVRVLLEELKAPYTLHTLNLKANEQRQSAYMAINPMGKVPAIMHQGVLVTELGAIYTYLADAFPAAGLAPAIGDPLRGAYLRWITFYGSSFEPAVTDKAMQRPPISASMSPYGDFETMWSTVVAQLGRGPYILGDRFTAADILWGAALEWLVMFKVLPELPVVMAYIARMAERPAAQQVKAADMLLAAEHVAAVAVMA